MNVRSIPAEWLPQYTYKDYRQWEGNWELISGLPYALSPSPVRKHQALGGRFVTLANNALAATGNTCACEVLYESDWIVNEYTVLRPDVMIVCNQPPSDFINLPPVLVLEIFSPESRLKDRNIKFKLYETYGVKYYILADPDRNGTEVFMLKDNRYQEAATASFQLTPSCIIEINLQTLWV